MPKFVDKQNLPQYRFFCDCISGKERINDLTADILTAEYQMKHGDKRGYMEAMVLLSRAKKSLPECVYREEVDIQRCRKEISVKNPKEMTKRMDKYVEMLLRLPFMQGMEIKKRQEISKETEESLSKSQLKRLYLYDKKEGKYYYEYYSVPKLLLINGDMYREYYSAGEFTPENLQELQQLMQKDVHYIINVQCEEQEECVYKVQMEENGELSIESLQRNSGSRKKVLDGKAIPGSECSAVLLSLLDYLSYMKKIIAGRKKKEQKAQGNTESGERTAKYVDKNSIKIFDFQADGNGKDKEMEVFKFKKRNGELHFFHKKGYEMIPHTRRGHYRTYKNGKVVYVRSSIIHKDKYDGIQSAHRINEE